MSSACPPRPVVWRWILLFLMLFSLAPQVPAVTLPQAAVAAQQTSKGSGDQSSQPDPDQQKAAYAALANILENEQSRQALIEQLRHVSTSPSASAAPELLPPVAEQEDKTVLQGLTEVTREYGGVVASQFVRLHDNIVKAPHKTFNPTTFINALNHFAGLALAMFAFYWLLRRLVYPIYRRLGVWGRHKTAITVTGCSCPPPSAVHLLSTCCCWRWRCLSVRSSATTSTATTAPSPISKGCSSTPSP